MRMKNLLPSHQFTCYGMSDFAFKIKYAKYCDDLAKSCAWDIFDRYMMAVDNLRQDKSGLL